MWAASTVQQEDNSNPFLLLVAVAMSDPMQYRCQCFVVMLWLQSGS